MSMRPVSRSRRQRFLISSLCHIGGQRENIWVFDAGKFADLADSWHIARQNYQLFAEAHKQRFWRIALVRITCIMVRLCEASKLGKTDREVISVAHFRNWLVWIVNRWHIWIAYTFHTEEWRDKQLQRAEEEFWQSREGQQVAADLWKWMGDGGEVYRRTEDGDLEQVDIYRARDNVI